MAGITSFKGTPLSNFSKHPVEYAGMIWPTSEHAFQAMKSVKHKDALKIQKAVTASYAKALGSTIEIRPDWDDVRDIYMREILTAKFAAGTPLAHYLAGTWPKTLIEGNYWHDNYWGWCTCYKCASKFHLNTLGSILMTIRFELIYGRTPIVGVDKVSNGEWSMEND